MLRTLSIHDFVIVDAIELELGSGFTVFTGETGAGKSILIDALARQAVRHRRADRRSQPRDDRDRRRENKKRR